MRIDELDKRLDNEFSSVYKIVLVDGDWGIGKTYLIKNKYKEHKTKYDKVIYASIFGVNSISEINLYMYNELHKVRGWAKKGYDYLLGGKELGVLSISIPFPEIKNTSNFIKKENNNILIIIDDIERKSDNVDINELVGMFESLSNIENVEVILIANTLKMLPDDKSKFDNFKEKVIEKIYNIDEYSEKAESSIIKKYLSDKNGLFDVVEQYFKKSNVKNLRILKKCIDFINQNLQYINFDKLDKSQKEELVQMEIYTVIEKINRDYLNDEAKENNSLKNLLVDKCVQYIMKKYFNNATPYYKHTIVNCLTKIYDDVNIEENSKIIESIYEEINNPQIEDIEKIEPFYLSEEQLNQRINSFNSKYMNRVDENLNIYEWFKKLSYLYGYAEKVHLHHKLKNEDILNTMDLYIEQLDTTEGIKSRHRLYWECETESSKIMEYLKILEDKISFGFCNKLFEEIKKDFHNGNYDFDKYEILLNNIMNNKEISIIRDKLYNEEFFIPNLNNELSEPKWAYTHSIWSKMRFIEDKKEFLDVVKKRLDNASKLGKYRIESLNKQYGIDINIDL